MVINSECDCDEYIFSGLVLIVWIGRSQLAASDSHNPIHSSNQTRLNQKGQVLESITINQGEKLSILHKTCTINQP